MTTIKSIPPIVGFHHVYANDTGIGARIADKQYDRLYRSGLGSITHEIHVGVLGGSYHPKSGICKRWHNSDPNRWELHTLDLMYTHALTHKGTFLYWYIHTKGASYGVDVPWRDKMEACVIDNHQWCVEALSLLEWYGSCGPFLSHNPHPFYAGNFFWTTSNHVRKLLPPYELLAERKSRGLSDELDRFIAEEWVTQGIPGRTVEEEMSDIKPYSFWNGEQPK